MQQWISAARPKTLPAALAPVLVGTALAAQAGEAVWLAAGICLLFALLIQVGTNYANDYYDFLKGADTAERVGPTRMVASGRIAPATMRLAMWIVFASALGVGSLLLFYGDWWLLLIGIACIVCGIAYTGGPYPLAYHGWGDLFVFLFFGVVAVCLTYYVQAGRFTADSLLVSIPIGALATNILVVNNYRDLESDRKTGKRTLVVRYGRNVALAQYQAMVLIALIVPLVLWMRGMTPAILLPVLSWPLTFFLRMWLLSARSRREFDRVLALTAGYLVLYALLFAAGLWFGG